MNRALDSKPNLASDDQLTWARCVTMIACRTTLFSVLGSILFVISWWAHFPANDSPLFHFLTEYIPAFRIIDRATETMGGNPMATKLLVLYVIVGGVLLALWGMRWSVRSENRQIIIARCIRAGMSTWQMVVCIPLMPAMVAVALYMLNDESATDSGIAVVYSAWWLSAPLLLTWGTAIAVLQIPFLPMLIHVRSTMKNRDERLSD